MASTIKEIKNPWLRTLAEYGLITVSIWIMVIGIYFFKFPNHFAFGGVTGFSTVFSQLLHCSASTFTTVPTTRCWYWASSFWARASASAPFMRPS